MIKKIFKHQVDMSLTMKITLTGLMIALAILGQKVFALNYLSFAPFLRISIAGPCVIIFASIVLGPIYGLCVGAFSDLLGYLIFDPKSYPLYFQITLIYSLLGFVSYFIYWGIRGIKNKPLLLTIMISLIVAAIIVCTIFMVTHDSITLFSTTYEIQLYQKILIPSLLVLLSGGLVLFMILFDKYKKRENDLFSPIQIGFASLIIEIFVMVIFGSLMKGWAFGFNTYIVILITQIIILFINVPLNTILLTLLLRVFIPQLEKRGMNQEEE